MGGSPVVGVEQVVVWRDVDPIVVGEGALPCGVLGDEGQWAVGPEDAVLIID